MSCWRPLFPWLVMLLGCPRAPAVPASQTRLVLSPCRLPGVAAALRCGHLEVLEDRARPNGRRLSLFVAVAPALSADPDPDPVFVLAGGPGQAATRLAPLLLPSLERVRRQRDLVFVDQRGTGRSAPLECPPTVAADAPLSAQLLARDDDTAVQRCAGQLSREHDLRHYGTAPAMEDLDEVRAALGHARVNLWGSSYGTRAALVYLREHPERVRAMVLDGVAPLELVYPSGLAAATDRALQRLFEACAADESCARTYPALAERFTALARSLEPPQRVVLPHPRTGQPEQVEVSKALLATTLQTLLYQPEATVLVPLTVARAAEGDHRPLVAQAELFGGVMSREVAMGMFLSVVCTEDVPLLDPAKELAAADATFAGRAALADVLSACRHWPRGEVPPGFRDPPRSEVPTLLLSGELDPVTPPERGEQARRTLLRARHVVFPATGHGATMTPCGRRLVADFLAAGSADALDVGCLPTRRPPFFVGFAGPPP